MTIRKCDLWLVNECYQARQQVPMASSIYREHPDPWGDGGVVLGGLGRRKVAAFQRNQPRLSAEPSSTIT